MKLDELEVGDTVHHKDYGTGKVSHKTSNSITVKFRKRDCLFKPTKASELEYA